MPKKAQSPLVTQSPLVHGSNPKAWQEAHEALTKDPVLWPRLQFRGIQPGVEGAFWETRHCPGCGSAINREITLNDALAIIAEESGVLHRTIGCLAPGSGR